MKLLAITIILSPLIANATVAIDYTTVGAPGNVADANGNGAMSTTFQMGRYEVTNAQYVQFLNSADPSGANSLALYNVSMTSNPMGGINFTGGGASGSKFSLKLGYDNYPVVFVNIFDTFRFTNWLHNGQASGTTESGAYTLLGGTPVPSNAGSIVRSPGAQVWIPNRNEWVKTAYYDTTLNGGLGGYHLYPTSSDTTPNNRPPNSTDANSANFYRNDGGPDVGAGPSVNHGWALTGTPYPATSGAANSLTPVGSYSLTTSPFGAYDMSGNALEWTDDPIGSLNRVMGGAWEFGFGPGYNGGGAASPSTTEGSAWGFRVASVPEPTTGFLVFSSLSLFMFRRHRTRHHATSHR